MGKSLMADQGGAVMVVGLFMALSLIGSLWYIIGIGDAVVFRDRAQEAADAVAFSSATVHARGMNMIAAINLIMFALVSLYLIMTIIDIILSVVQNLLILCLPIPIAGEICAPIEAIVTPIHEAYHPIWYGYCIALKFALPGAGLLQSVVGIGAPFGGLVAGINVAGDYDQSGLAFSSSMAPGFTGFGGGDTTSQGSAAAGAAGSTPGSKKSGGGLGSATFRIGLPVENEDLKEMCGHSIQLVMEAIKGLLQGIPGLGSVLTFKVKVLGFGLDVWEMIENKLADMGKETLCPSKYHALGIDIAGGDGSAQIPWENGLPGAGSKKMWDPAKNGNDWMQVWGFIINPEFKSANSNVGAGDHSENKISLASTKGRGGLGVTQPNVPAMYLAQAEFYFDCKGGWEEDDCNGSNDELSKALYSIRWRARLRRVRTPDIGGMLGDYLGQILSSDGVKQWARGALKNSDAFKKTYLGVQKLAEKFGGTGGTGQQWTRKAFAWLIKEDGGIDKAIDAATDKIPGNDPNATKPGVFH
jgi:hypothetical protein